MSRPRRRLADDLARRVAQSLALDLRLEGVGPDVLVSALDVSHAQAVALLDGHPTALRLDHLRTVADLAHVDLYTTVRAAEAGQREGGDPTAARGRGT